MRPNLFRYATSELSQDAFILWLLEWANPECATEDNALHKTAQDFVRLLLKNKNLEIRSVECKKQENYIDVFAIVNKKYAVIIEDKTNTSEHSNQLKRYSEWVLRRKKYSDLELYCVYYKTGNESYAKLNRLAGSYKKEFPFEHFSIITRKEVLDVLNQSTTNNAIFCDYVEHLRKIQNITLSYSSLPINKWKWEAWQGFYMALEKELNTGDWGYVANPSGGFLGFWWNWKNIASNPDVQIYLQFEQTKLCVKAYQKNGVKEGIKYSDQIIRLAAENRITFTKPSKRRCGKTMTLAHVYLQISNPLNMADIICHIKKVMCFIDYACGSL